MFTSVPHQTAMEVVPALLAADCRVVDLSADFRFRDAAVYETWYQPHTAPELLAEAVYGLPELHGAAISRARLVGNPGCYPTCVILGLAPLVAGQTGPPELPDCRLQVREPAAPAARRPWPPSTAKSMRASGPIKWRSTATTPRWSRS